MPRAEEYAMSLLHGTSGPPDVEVLKSRGDVSGLIETLVAHGDVAVCTAALQTLVEIGHAREAVEVLKETTAVWAIQPLIALLTNTDVHVSQGAVEALGRIGPPAVEPLVVALGDERYREARKAVALALAQIGDARAVESLRAARKFGQRDLRTAAAEVLAQLGWQGEEHRARSQANAEFLHRLREEALHHKQRRASLVLQKLAFVVALFGVVVLRTPVTPGTPVSLLDDFYWLLYALPFVALAYDVYICAEDYKVKRIGTFFRTSRHVGLIEREWELYVNDHRETLTAWAGPFLTSMTVIVPALVLPLVLGKQMGAWFYAWLIIGIFLLVFLASYYQFILLRRLISSPSKEAVSTARNASLRS
jgi:hypothetical protein